MVNLGSNESITIKNLAGKIIGLTGSHSGVRFLTYEQAYGQPFDDMLDRCPDLSRAARLIGFKPRYSLDDSLKQIIAYQESLMTASV